MATPVPQGNAVRLASASAFTSLPRPHHDEVTGGIRHGSERVPAMVGAFLLVVAPFGAWTRVTEVAVAGEEARVAGEVLGIDLAAGGILLVAAVAAVVATIGFGRRHWIHRIAVAAGLVAVVLPLARLVALQRDLDLAVQQAVSTAEAASRTVGLGWGGWAAMVGAAAMAVAVLVAVLVQAERTRPAPDPEAPSEGRRR